MFHHASNHLEFHLFYLCWKAFLKQGTHLLSPCTPPFLFFFLPNLPPAAQCFFLQRRTFSHYLLKYIVTLSCLINQYSLCNKSLFTLLFIPGSPIWSKMAACQHINILINIKQLTFYLSLSLLTAEHTRCIQIKKKTKNKNTDKLFKVKKCESIGAQSQRVCVRLVGHCINGQTTSLPQFHA